jgi:hypothetical protein
MSSNVHQRTEMWNGQRDCAVRLLSIYDYSCAIEIPTLSIGVLQDYYRVCCDAEAMSCTVVQRRDQITADNSSRVYCSAGFAERDGHRV